MFACFAPCVSRVKLVLSASLPDHCIATMTISLRHLFIRTVLLVLALLNCALAIGDKKFLKGFILGLLFAAQKKDTTVHQPVMMPYVHHDSEPGHCDHR